MTWRPLRMAFLTPEYVSEPKFDGGLANYLYRVVRGLSELGHDPEVFVLADRDETLVHDGITVHRVQRRQYLWANRMRRWVRRLRGPDLGYALYVREGAHSLARALQQRQAAAAFDVVQCSDFGATALSLPKNRPFVVVSRLSWYAPLWRVAYGQPHTLSRLWAEQMERSALRRSDAIYGPSMHLATRVAQEVGREVRVIRPPVNLSVPIAQQDPGLFARLLSGKAYVLFFGRICALKGVYELAEAMREVLAAEPDLYLVLVGREDPPGTVDRLRVILGTHHERLIHLPRQRHAELFPIIRGARCVALPSRIDNFPNACLEAMLNGQIVVGTIEGGFAELIEDGRSGFLAHARDPQSLSNALQRALALPDEHRAAIQTAALSLSKEFNAQDALHELVRFYENICS